MLLATEYSTFHIDSKRTVSRKDTKSAVSATAKTAAETASITVSAVQRFFVSIINPPEVCILLKAIERALCMGAPARDRYAVNCKTYASSAKYLMVRTIWLV